MPALVTAHIHFDKEGVAWIDETNTKVIEVAMDKIAHGWSPEEIHFQHPHLSLAQIHAALGFYYDHQVELDEAIRSQFRDVQSRQKDSLESPLRKRLQELMKHS